MVVGDDAWVVEGEDGCVVVDGSGNGGVVRVVRDGRVVEVELVDVDDVELDEVELDDDVVVVSGWPPMTGGGNCSTGEPESAASMNFFHTRAGRVPPVTALIPSTFVSVDLSCGVFGS